nr:MAG: internal scaffolding protein [Microvirus sp.]QJB19637.1 MAG: internal scaffolding protein [Microvirus sp.]
MFVRSPFNYDADVVSHRSGLDCSESPSMAWQAARDEVDINNLVARFGRTGLPTAPAAPVGIPDFTEVADFQSALNQVIEARRGFDQLPSRVRRRFDNDPGEFLSFVGDDGNLEEAISLGLVPKPTPVAPEPSAPVLEPSE